MNTLNQAHCEACRADAPQVSDEELPILIKQIPDWNIEVRDGVMQLEKVFLFKNFKFALAFTNAVGQSDRDLVEPLDQRPAPQRLHHGRTH